MSFGTELHEEKDYALREKASYAYIISIVIMVAAVPLPIVGLGSSFIYFLSQSKSPYFVRWHSMQALLMQIPLFIINAPFFFWTVKLLISGQFGNLFEISTLYWFSFLIVILVNLAEILISIFLARSVARGKNIRVLGIASMTDSIVKPTLIDRNRYQLDN